MVGGDYVQRNIECLALDGRLVQIAFPAGATTRVNLGPVLQQRLTITGSTLRPRYGRRERRDCRRCRRPRVAAHRIGRGQAHRSRDVSASLRRRRPSPDGVERAHRQDRARRMISRDSFVALQHRNFRLIWIGLLVSFTGSMMQNAALLWHVSLLVPPERKGLALGLVGLVRVVPIVVFSMISGVVADAWDRRRLMLFTQLCSALVSGRACRADVPGLDRACGRFMCSRRWLPRSARSICRRGRRWCRRSCRASTCRTPSA